MPRNPTTGLFTRTDNSFSNPVLGTLIDPSDASDLFDDYDTGLSLESLTGPLIMSNTTDITGPNPGWTVSGALQVYGGADIEKNFQVRGGRMYLGDGSSTTGYAGATIFNLNGYNVGAAAGVVIDMDLASSTLAMRIGNFSAATNGLVSGVYDATPTYMSGMPNGSGIAHRFVRAVGGNPPISDNMYLNVDLSVTLFGPLTVPSIVGTATNDSAAAGRIGEYISSSIAAGSAVSLTSTTAANVTSISLTAGDWDVEGNVSFLANAATTSTAHGAWISTTSAAFPTPPNGGALNISAAPVPAGASPSLPAGRVRISLAGTTTVYLSGYSEFAVNTMKAYGFIGARRAR